jgi:TolB-like protein
MDPVGAAPTEKQVAEQVLSRDNFDPQADSLVRKEMARLREKLARFYATDGLREEIRISAENGYLLKFEFAERNARHEDRPCWLILPFRSSSDLREQSLYLMDELLVRLGEQGRYRLISPISAIAFGARSGDVRVFAQECGADVVAEGSLRWNREKLESAAWFVSGHTGQAERSRRFVGEHVTDLAKDISSWLVIDEAQVAHG